MAAELTGQRQRLLFISPVFPYPEGNGLAMRPYYQIVQLSRIYSIHLLVVGTHSEEMLAGADIYKYCDEVEYVFRHRYAGWKDSLWCRYRRFKDEVLNIIKGCRLSFVEDLAYVNNEALAKVATKDFDRVHVFRLYLAPVAEKLRSLGLCSYYSLDIDDIESLTRKSISRLYAANGNQSRASRLEKEADIYFSIEEQRLPDFDEIFTCSRCDSEYIVQRFPQKIIKVLPNVIPIPKAQKKSRHCKIFTMLFVGTMGYYPNTDALLFFVDQIAPLLRLKSPKQWRLRVIGSMPEKEFIERFAHIAELDFCGQTADLASEYEAADIAIVPVRGGGGTRIKAIEAFAHSVPVVSTTKGIEGINCADGIHLLIADEPADFAAACILLMNDTQLAKKISDQAYRLAESEYSLDIINRAWTGN